MKRININADEIMEVKKINDNINDNIKNDKFFIVKFENYYDFYNTSTQAKKALKKLGNVNFLNKENGISYYLIDNNESIDFLIINLKRIATLNAAKMLQNYEKINNLQ